MGAGRLRCHSNSHLSSSVWLYTSSSLKTGYSISGFAKTNMKSGHLSIGAQKKFLLPREVEVCHTDTRGGVISKKNIVLVLAFPEVQKTQKYVQRNLSLILPVALWQFHWVRQSSIHDVMEYLVNKSCTFISEGSKGSRTFIVSMTIRFSHDQKSQSRSKKLLTPYCCQGNRWHRDEGAQRGWTLISADLTVVSMEVPPQTLLPP